MSAAAPFTCVHGRPGGFMCPHCPIDTVFAPPVRSAVERACQLVEAKEAAEADARQQLHLAEATYCANGRLPNFVDWMAEARLAHDLAKRIAFEAREGLRKAEIAAAEEARR